MPPCPFCPPDRDPLAESELALAFPDAFPVSPGHALVVPRRHVASYFECTADEKAALWALVDGMHERAAARDPRPDGYNVGINVGWAAGQTVFHVHIHVIPRYTGDSADPRGGVRHVLSGTGHYPSAPR